MQSNGVNKEQWQNVRDSLLRLHKALLEFERKVYEGQHGKVASPGVMLGLVMENPAFAWLRQLSELVVGIYELLESKEEVPTEKYRDMLAYCTKLLTPNQNGNTFEKNYFTAIQQSPDAALCHSQTQLALQKISLT